MVHIHRTICLQPFQSYQERPSRICIATHFEGPIHVFDLLLRHLHKQKSLLLQEFSIKSLGLSSQGIQGKLNNLGIEESRVSKDYTRTVHVLRKIDQSRNLHYNTSSRSRLILNSSYISSSFTGVFLWT